MPSVTTLADLSGYTMVILFTVTADAGPDPIFFASNNTGSYSFSIINGAGNAIAFDVNQNGTPDPQSISLGGPIVPGTQYLVVVKFNPGLIGFKAVYTYNGSTLTSVGFNFNAQALTYGSVNQSFTFGDNPGAIQYFYGAYKKIALYNGDPGAGQIETMLNAANTNTGSYTFVSASGWYDATVGLAGAPPPSAADPTQVALDANFSQYMIFQSFAAYGSGGGGAGDPYVTTVDGVRYKLPIMDGPVRFYQGAVDGKTLTINASLRTFENTDMIAENIRSYNDLKGKVPAYKLNEVAKSIFKAETLAFFEKFHINYDGTEMTVDVWDHKFKIESYTGKRFPSTLVDGKALTQKYTGIYQEYKSQTLKLQIGSAALFLSVYPAKLLKNGIFFEATDMESGNGVIVNTLSQKDMTLKSLTDLTPAPNKNTRPQEKTEWFLDKDGYRTKKIMRAAC